MPSAGNAGLQASGFVSDPEPAPLNPHLQALADEIIGNEVYEGLSDGEVAELLNTPSADHLARVHTDVATARGVLLAAFCWPKVIMNCDSSQDNVNIRAACITVRDTLSPPMQQCHTGDPETFPVVQQLLESLIAPGILTQEVVDKLLSLSLVRRAWFQIAEGWTGEPVLAREVHLARGGY